MKFEILREETNEAQITFTANIDNETKIAVSLKWDGCSNLYAGRNPLHICDLDALAEMLRQMRAKALEYFDGEWCVAPLLPEEVKQKIATFIAP